MIEIDKKVLF